MPGRNDRQPASPERPPASRVGDELQKRADEVTDEEATSDPERVEQAEREAFEAAEETQWNRPATEQERRPPR